MSSRSYEVLKRLQKLHFLSQLEGLFQLLDHKNVTREDIINKKRCLIMTMFLPSTVNFVLNNSSYLECSYVTKTPKSNKKTDSSFCKVFVNNISFNVKGRELWNFFGQFGKVLKVHIVRDKRTNRSKGCAFVHYSSNAEAVCALQVERYLLSLDGRTMTVERFTKQPVFGKLRRREDLYCTLKLKKSLNNSVRDETMLLNCERLENTSLIDNINEDVLLEIFLYLDIRSRIRIESVCRRWQRLAIRSWKDVSKLHFKNVFKIDYRHASLTDWILRSVLKKGCQNLVSLDLSASPFLITHESLVVVGSVCKRLLHLNLSQTLVQNKTLKYLGKHLHKLKVVHLCHCLDIGEKGLWWFLKGLVALEEFHFTESTRIHGQCLYMLPPSLQVLDLNRCPQINGQGLKHVAKCCTNLTLLDLSFCSGISDDGLKILSEKCVRINVLRLRGSSTNVTVNGLLNIKKFKYLTNLDISQNCAVEDEVIKTIGINCLNIRCLNLEACHGDISCQGIKALFLYQNLQELNISYIVKVCDDCIGTLALKGKLKSLIIRSCTEVSNTGVLECLRYLDELVKLDLSGCFLIDDWFTQSHVLTERRSILQLILGGTEVTNDGVKRLKEVLNLCDITMCRLNVPMLRNDRDPTLIGQFFPDSSDDEAESLEEELNNKMISHFEVDDFDALEDVERINCNGDVLWEVLPPSQDLSLETNKLNANGNENSGSREIEGEIKWSCTEEDWEDEVNTNEVWNIPLESLTRTFPLSRYDDFINDDNDDFIIDDDLSLMEDIS